MKKYLLGLLAFLVAIPALAVTPPYYVNQQYTSVADTKTWTNPAPNDYYYRGNYHFVASSSVVKTTACPEGVVVRGTGTVEAREIRGTKLYGDGSGISGIIGGAVFALQADVAASTAAERGERIAADVLIGQATGQAATASLNRDVLLGQATGYEQAARIVQDTLIGQATGQAAAGSLSRDVLIGQTTGYEQAARIAQDVLIGQATGQTRASLTAETSARQAADILLGQTTGQLLIGLNNETVARIAGDVVLGQTTGQLRIALTAETVARIAADILAGQATGQLVLRDTAIARSTGMIAGMEGAGAGDLWVYDGARWTRQSLGSEGQILVVSGSSVAWKVHYPTEYMVSPSTGIQHGTLDSQVKVTTASIVANGIANTDTFLRGDGRWAIIIGTQAYTEVFLNISSGAYIQANKAEINALHLATATERTARMAQDVLIGQATGYTQGYAAQLKGEIDSIHLATATERTARIAGDVLIGQATGYMRFLANGATLYFWAPGDQANNPPQTGNYEATMTKAKDTAFSMTFQQQNGVYPDLEFNFMGAGTDLGQNFQAKINILGFTFPDKTVQTTQGLAASSGAYITANKLEINALHLSTATERAASIARDVLLGQTTGQLVSADNEIKVSTGNFYSKTYTDATYAVRTATNSVMADSLKLGGVVASGYALVGSTNGVMADSDKLDGQHGSYYLLASSGLQITTNKIEIDALHTATDTERTARINADGTKLAASSGPWITSNKLEIDSLHGSTLTLTQIKADREEVRNSTNTLAVQVAAVAVSTGIFVKTTDVIYSTSSMFAQFSDSTTVNLVGFQSIIRFPFDFTPKNWFIVGDASGTATVAISTGMITGTGLTFGVSHISAALPATVQYATGALVLNTIPRGYYMKFLVTAAATCKEVYVSVEGWKR